MVTKPLQSATAYTPCSKNCATFIFAILLLANFNNSFRHCKRSRNQKHHLEGNATPAGYSHTNAHYAGGVNNQWRIQDAQTVGQGRGAAGAEVERRRREDRDAAGCSPKRGSGVGRGVPSPPKKGSGEGKFSTLDLKMATLGAFWALCFYNSFIWFKRKKQCFRVAYFAPPLKGSGWNYVPVLGIKKLE